MIRNVWRLAIILSGFLFLLPVNHGFAQDFNIDIGSPTPHGTPSIGYGAAAAQAGFWNQIGGVGPTTLTDISSTATAATISLSYYSMASWSTGTPPDADKLLADNLYATGSWTATVAGLTNGNYDIYLYAPCHSSMSTGTMSVNGTSVASLPGDSSSPYDLILGTTYATLQVTVSAGSLSLSGTGGDSDWVGLAGIQIVGEPPTGACCGGEAGEGNCTPDRTEVQCVESDSGTWMGAGTVCDPNPCICTATANAGNDVTICNGDTTTLDASGSSGTAPLTYSWSPSASLSSATAVDPTASPSASTTYTVTVTATGGCTDSDEVTVTVCDNPSADAGDPQTICAGEDATLGTAGEAGYNYSWSPPTNLNNPNIAQPVASWPATLVHEQRRGETQHMRPTARGRGR